MPPSSSELLRRALAHYELGVALPRLRRRVVRDLRGGSPHDQVVAAIVRLLDVTGLRVGNAEYARENGSFGLTTLRDGLGNSLNIPIADGRLRLGTWQGIYLCEHRNHGGSRRFVVTIHGE